MEEGFCWHGGPFEPALFASPSLPACTLRFQRVARGFESRLHPQQLQERRSGDSKAAGIHCIS